MQQAAVDQVSLTRAIGEFIADRCYPLEKFLLNGDYQELMPQLEQCREEVRERGWWAPALPISEGGMGLSLANFAAVSEVLGHSPLAHYVFNCQAPDIGNMELLLSYGTSQQKQQWFRPLAEGKIRSCFAMTEPENAGSNPLFLKTTAVKDGEDYLINGHKWFTSSADGAAFTIVMAMTNPSAEKPHARFSQIIVPLDTPGFEFVRNIPIMGDEGAGYFSHSEVRFNNCRVPCSNLIGEEGSGFALAQARLGPGRIHHCMRWIGICERALDLSCRRAVSRELSPGRPLGSRQAIQFWIAEARAEIDASRLLVLATADKIDRVGSRAASVDISVIKFYVSGVLQRVLDRSIQMHGALGITDDTVLSHWFRHERGARIYDGPDEVHKTVVARKILESYGLSR